ncbi:MAG: HEAT repeat domain-containing protein [Holosporales bacterium]|jgi:HEAT repeat protein|nr:HEAT repeat domain-containing protein [Holosporales bacterium]
MFRDALAHLLEDPNADVRDNATRTLGYVVNANPDLATAELKDALVERLQDQDAGVIARAAETLGYVVRANHALAIPELIDVLAYLLQQDRYVCAIFGVISVLRVIVEVKPELVTDRFRDALRQTLLQNQDFSTDLLDRIRDLRPDLFPAD